MSHILLILIISTIKTIFSLKKEKPLMKIQTTLNPDNIFTFA